MLKKAIIPYWATWPVILAIFIGPPNWEVSPLPLSKETIKSSELVVTNHVSLTA